MDMLKRIPSHIAVPLAIFLGVLLLDFAITALQPRLYEAKARIWVQPRNQGTQRQDVFSPLSTFFTSPLVTAAEVIRSGVVLQEASEILRQRNPHGPVQSPDEILHNLTAKPVTNADVLKVTYRSASNSQATAVLQSVIDAFQRVNNAQSTGSAAKSRESIEQQLDMLRKQSNETRKALKEFQDRNQAVSLPEQVSSLLKQSAASEAEIEKYKLKIAEQRSKLDYFTSQLGLGPEDALLAFKLAQDEELTVLRKKIALDQARLISLHGAYRDEHPFIKELKSSIAEAKSAAENRVRSLSAHSEQSVDMDKLLNDDPVRQKLIEDMVTARSEEISAQSGLTQTTSLLADTNARLANIPAAQGQLAELTRKDKVTSEALSEAERSLHGAQLNEATASHVADIRIIDPPFTPHELASPNIWLNLAIGIVLGLVLASVAFFSSPNIWNLKDVFRILDYPILDWVAGRDISNEAAGNLRPMHRLRLAVQQLLTKSQKCVIVSSANCGDGKTLVASSLAESCAQSGVKVLLIDANLYSPELHKRFNLPISPGLSEYLATKTEETLHRAVRQVNPFLRVITAGSSTANILIPAGVVQELIRLYESDADIIIIDTPASRETSDSLSLIGPSTVVLVVVRLAHTYRASLRLLQAQLRNSQVVLGGVVIIGGSEEGIASALNAPSQGLKTEVATW